MFSLWIGCLGLNSQRLVSSRSQLRHKRDRDWLKKIMSFSIWFLPLKFCTTKGESCLKYFFMQIWVSPNIRYHIFIINRSWELEISRNRPFFAFKITLSIGEGCKEIWHVMIRGRHGLKIVKTKHEKHVLYIVCLACFEHISH